MKLAAAGVVPAGSWRRCRTAESSTGRLHPRGAQGIQGDPRLPRSRPAGSRRGASGSADVRRRQLGDRGRIRIRVSDAPRAAAGGRFEVLRGVWKNVVAQAASARAARTQFENGFGDALVTYEQEASSTVARQAAVEVVYPRSTILSEHTLVRLDRNIAAADRPLLDAFVAFLWSDAAQALFETWFSQRGRGSATRTSPESRTASGSPISGAGNGRKKRSSMRLEGPGLEGARKMSAAFP